ncbi:sensor histidine kinase [Ammoniphilus sp. YIM 78166]|uniref:sensor histidine kinase n=1 Tax=Ammoniphilus sp. YIM 78166 TaxID=1644106 RepID=UPI00106F5FB3|nr:ATP-binding protein [Ammoniphilus sp. YIM 78166]
MAYLNKTEEIKAYLNDLGKELQQVNQFMTTNPILSSILLSKSEAYKEQEVEIQTCIEANLKELNMKPIHLINIVGNLLDNARDALLTTDLNKKIIYVSTIKLNDQVRITVRNERPILDEEMIEKILAKGFSTKGTDGLGLSIVQNMSALYHADFQVYSEFEGGTRFEVIFPLK